MRRLDELEKHRADKRKSEEEGQQRRDETSSVTDATVITNVVDMDVCDDESAADLAANIVVTVKDRSLVSTS
jgi:hypothetical protein